MVIIWKSEEKVILDTQAQERRYPLLEKGHSVSEETRKKIADKLKGTHLTEETKAKLSILRKGKKVHTEESKRKIGAASKGRNVGRIRIDKRSLNFLDIRSEY